MSNTFETSLTVGGVHTDHSCALTSHTAVTAWTLFSLSESSGISQRYPVQCQPFTVGRNPSNQLAITNSTVSGTHAELIEVPPDILKFDVKFVQGLSCAATSRRTTVASLIGIVKDLNVIPLAEGIETEQAAAICRDLGFELAQGYLFGRAAPADHWTKSS